MFETDEEYYEKVIYVYNDYVRLKLKRGIYDHSEYLYALIKLRELKIKEILNG
jgi:hypothetical protein